MIARLFAKKAALFLLLVLLAACAPALVPDSPQVNPTRPQATASLVEAQPTPTVPANGPAVSTPDLAALAGALDDDPQRAALLQFILEALAGTEKQHLLVAYVQPNQADPRGKLSLSEDNILRAWVYQDGGLHDAEPAFFAQSYIQEPNGPWSYAYLAFSINQVSPDHTSATVHIDRIPGLAGGKGQIFELVRDGEHWSVKGQRATWIQ